VSLNLVLGNEGNRHFELELAPSALWNVAETSGT